MKVKLETFHGIVPMADPRRLGDFQAQTAQNINLLNGIAAAVKEPGLIQTLESDTISVFSYNGNWLEFSTDVDVVKGSVLEDQFDRIYYTGSGYPKVRGTDPVTSVETVQALGVPRPVIKLSATATDKSTVTWKRRGSGDVDGTWEYQYEEADGTISQSGTLTEGAGATNVAEVTAGSSYTVTTKPARTTASSSATLVLWFDAYSAAGSFLGRLYPAISAQANNSTFELSGAPASANQTNADSSPNITFIITYDSSRDVGYEISRTYVYTFQTVWGEQGPPSLVSSNVNVTPTQNVALTTIEGTVPAYSDSYDDYKQGMVVIQSSTYYVANIDIGDAEAFDSTKWDSYGATNPWNISKVNIYRTLTTDSGQAFQFVKQIDFGTTTATDDVLDEDVAANEVLPSEGWLIPPVSLSGLVMMPGMFMAGFVGDEMYFAVPNFPHAWFRGWNINLKSTGVANAIGSEGLVSLQAGKPQLIYGTHPDSLSIQDIETPQACVSKRSVTTVGDVAKAVIYASPDGLMLIEGTIPRRLTKGFYEKEHWTELTPSSMIGAVHDGRYYGSTATGMIIMDPDAGLAAITSTDQVVFGLREDLESDLLYMIQTSGANRVLNTWGTGTNNMTLTWKSKEYTFNRRGSPSVARILAAEYEDDDDVVDKVRLRILAEGTEVFNELINAENRGQDPDLAFKLPTLRDETRFSLQFEAKVDVYEVLLSTSMGDL